MSEKTYDKLGNVTLKDGIVLSSGLSAAIDSQISSFKIPAAVVGSQDQSLGNMKLIKFSGTYEDTASGSFAFWVLSSPGITI